MTHLDEVARAPTDVNGSDLSPNASNAVFLIGAARSGTSLLFKALCLHPDAAWISNWVRRAPWAPQLAVLNRLPRSRPDGARRAWFDDDSNAYVYGKPRSLARRLYPAPVEGEPVFAHCGIPELEPAAAKPDAPQRLRRSFAAIQRYGGGTVVVNKRIANNRRIPLLAEAFPKARFVVLVRDGRAVARSLGAVDWWEESVVWWYGGTPREWASEGRDPLEICARNWVEELREIEEGLEAVPDDQVMRLTYESLIAEPVSALQAVARFAGLRTDSSWTTALGKLRFPDRNDGWRSRMSEDDVARIEEFQRDALVAHGYLT
jgi:hypothetical protein